MLASGSAKLDGMVDGNAPIVWDLGVREHGLDQDVLGYGIRPARVEATGWRVSVKQGATIYNAPVHAAFWEGQHVMRSMRLTGVFGVALCTLALAQCGGSGAPDEGGALQAIAARDGDWPMYRHDLAATGYSLLAGVERRGGSDIVYRHQLPSRYSDFVAEEGRLRSMVQYVFDGQ